MDITAQKMWLAPELNALVQSVLRKPGEDEHALTFSKAHVRAMLLSAIKATNVLTELNGLDDHTVKLAVLDLSRGR